MSIDPCEVEALVTSLANSKTGFSFAEAVAHLSDPSNNEALADKLTKDTRFLHFRGDSLTQMFLPRQSLAQHLAYLNIRLAAAGISYASCDLVLKSLVSSRALLENRWQRIPEPVLEFAEYHGLLRSCSDCSLLCFPLSRILIQIAGNYRGSRKRKTLEPIYQSFVELVCCKALTGVPTSEDLVEQVFSELPQRQRSILLLRTGLKLDRRATLEEIGRELAVTRERVRQLEMKAYKSLGSRENARKMESALLASVIERSGSIVYKLKSRSGAVAVFLSDRCGVPFTHWSEIGCGILGFSPSPLPPLSDMKRLILSNRPLEHVLATPLLKGLASEDVSTLTRLMDEYARKRLTRAERAYLSLKEIGHPAHFAEITVAHNQLFPEHWSEEHNIHSVLTRKEDSKIVWIGLKGVYALKEWGYEQPNKDLFETVAEIVEEVYRKTYRPVNVNDVFASIGKYRKLYNRNSVLMALQFNVKLVPASSDSFLPRWATDEDSKAEDEDELDQILKKFERK